MGAHEGTREGARARGPARTANSCEGEEEWTHERCTADDSTRPPHLPGQDGEVAVALSPPGEGPCVPVGVVWVVNPPPPGTPVLTAVPGAPPPATAALAAASCDLRKEIAASAYALGWLPTGPLSAPGNRTSNCFLHAIWKSPVCTELRMESMPPGGRRCCARTCKRTRARTCVCEWRGRRRGAAGVHGSGSAHADSPHGAAGGPSA